MVAPPEQQHERGKINEGDLPVSMFLIPIAAPMRSSIVYPEFGMNNFQIRPDWMNLMNAALEWLDIEPHASITTWEELTRKFCNKFFPPTRVAKIRLEIQTFQKKEEESYHEAWNRFNEMMRKCPNHGITIGNQVQYFYTGLKPLSKSQVDASAGGSIIGKSVQQTMELFELIATTHLMFSSERVVPLKTGGMYELDSTTSTNAQIAALTKQVELLVKLQSHGANAMMTSSACENCGKNHATESCMMLTSLEEQVNFIQISSRNFNSYGNNFPQERRPSLGEMFQQYVQKTDKVFQQIDMNFQSQQASIKKLETQIGQIAQQLAEHPQGILPGNTTINPKEQLMTLKVVENDLPRAPVKVKPEITTERPKRKDDQEVIDEATRVEKSAPNATKNGESIETSAVKAPSLDKAYMPPIPFPQKLKKNKQDTKNEKFLDVLKKLQINVPFINAILQILSYTKFLKDMLTK
ncbi:uncharacterized protein LOC111395266 [Olea europaea var. sylvestris]|uniref:uncharacterized protein LOC111395266 n=1 Tax=Olea europaea var. sylvestris TaxID=158386 RepID=UPI000C1D0C2B|nr:uncharacterized protein LOC111395266 [Olea europaea var. sylvestris]